VESLLARAGGASGFLNGAAFEAVAALMSDEHGTLIGRQIGVYRVDARLGAGGMGEVYRARDQKLGRDVAIKVLPTAFTSDSERLARFEREARLLATLNHPNIGAIYGFEESDGVRALILELVDGDTLAELLARADRRAKGQEHTGLPLNQALTIASQIADALDAAHEKGIVHRDLKPANIKITRDGAVKVLDFGLAKLTQASDPGLQTPDLSNLPTVTVGHTHEGLILGTAAYMSPEQASGQPIDKRTDIWAFGCVLYELLTGKQTFTGKSVPEILGSIFKAEPDWSLLPATTPREISTLIRRCLQKEAKNRYHSAADIRIAIEDEIGTSLSGSPVAVQSPATANKLRERLAWAAAAIAAVAALTLAFLHFRPAPTAGSVTRFAVMLPSNERLAVSACQNLALSPDGTHMAYVTTEPGGALQLRLRTTDGLETKTVLKINRGGLDSLFFSPDGQWLGFWADRVLKKVPLSGGTPITLVNENVCGTS
jgi:serine/threonine protein kinase